MAAHPLNLFIHVALAQIKTHGMVHAAGIILQDLTAFARHMELIVVAAIARGLPEKQRFYRGLADWVGYPHASIPFDVGARVEGEGKWTLWNLIDLATTATVSFTSAPLRIVTILGSFTLVFGF